ncbi:Nif3-like dinuclear metal center hexameric protein [Gulosibacter macacae]|uniref:GTP cyclohydrolase 1 type 2 homolog n=1 Tax=Gulosibacter macacae TaxID=2488791 RepID=A0A3P3W2Z3_9MICO|nr:Nif3-like dinuclear metal center hexameric protein [Gulosibacter macacae]RRJ88797.1 Nif3-like dinuclear metal center hexameric protein [Gulosibacter macacae]
MTTLRELQATIEALFPERGAESWDAIGTVTGDPDATVTKMLLAVDPVASTVDEALEWGADLLFTHHPLLLRGVTSVAEDTYKGRLIARLIRGGCALHAAHTNADVVESGPTGVIFDRLGIPAGPQARTPIKPLPDDPARGIGLVGELPEAITLGEFATLVAQIFPPTSQGVRVAGDSNQIVKKVACCSGSGDSLLSHPAVTGADVYLTSDLRHHPASEAREQALLNDGKPALVDIAHSVGESLWLEGAATQLRAAHPDVEVRVSTHSTDPWDAVIPSFLPDEA